MIPFSSSLACSTPGQNKVLPLPRYRKDTSFPALPRVYRNGLIIRMGTLSFDTGMGSNVSVLTSEGLVFYPRLNYSRTR